MGSGARPTLRIPLILLALANLAVLGMKVWPWQDLSSLGGNGTAALDPALCLLGYIAVIFWLVSSSDDPTGKALSAGTMLGLLGGVCLAAEIFFRAHSAIEQGVPPAIWTRGFFAVAALAWGMAGVSGARASGGGMGMMTGAWSAMVSCLLASTAFLGQLYFAGPLPPSTDPWKQYQGLAIGDPATQAMVQSLNSVTFYMLIGPMVGAGIGLLFALLAPEKKK
jgi:hypothetical protein